ncbi:MAG: dihydrolipoyl dehydrogenase family protein [Actinomycetota bacterium]
MLGLGTGGEDLALQLLDGGLSVAGVEPRLVGGECPFWACIPSKMAIRASNLVAEARRIEGVAGSATVTPDWSQVARRIREEAAGGWDDSAAVDRFQSRGGHLVRGWGRLDGPGRVVVGDRTLVARRGVVIATGSRPAIPPIPGLDDVPYWTTHEAISAGEAPESLVVLGGGPVGCELAQTFARFGTDVTVVEGRPRLLPNEEPEASRLLATALESEGIRLRLGSRVSAAERAEPGIRLMLEDGSDLAARQVLVATGRVVDTSELGLETAGVAADSPFIPVDERMRAGEGIWAMGDVTGKAMFTHVAYRQGVVIAADLLGRDVAPVDYDALPRVTFTDPEVGAVGLTEEQARGRGMDVAVATKEVPATFRGWLHDTGMQGLVKLVIDEGAGTLVGGTVAAPGGGEILGLVSLAVHQGTPIDDLRAMTYAFPTFHGAIGEALGAYARGSGTVIDPDYAVHGYLPD